ncbi:MAG: hypothetical protein H0U02_13325, partial [Rubrobacter sp.]|nr:hypothetical protein [Rubrobacter sp.]
MTGGVVLARIGMNGKVLAVSRRIDSALGRLRAGGWPILQTAVAASLAWTLASMVLGHERPFFAAI